MMTTHAGEGTTFPSGHIRLARNGHAASLIIDRPANGNAWLVEMWSEAVEALGICAADEEVRIVLIVSGGGAIFSGGADLDQLQKLTSGVDAAAAVDHLLAAVEGFLATIERLGKVVVAVIDGACIGAGLEIAAACDLRLATDRARFGIPAARHGLVIARPDVARLARLVGWALASELLLTARTLDADEALQRGLVNRVVPSSELEPAADELVSRVGSLSAPSVAAMKRHLHAVWPAPTDDAGFDDSRAGLLSDDFHAALANRQESKTSGKRATDGP